MIKLPDEFNLELIHDFDSENDPAAIAYVNAKNFLYEKAKNGTLYAKWIGGDRKGSIARLIIDKCDYDFTASIKSRFSYHHSAPRFHIENPYFYATAKWDKRKNSCRVSFPNNEIVFLPNYVGPTIYKMFDKKAAREEALRNPDVRDLDDEKLSINDKVLYINSRYGSGYQLCHGTITEFIAHADSRGTAITTIVKNDDIDEYSSITTPSTMLWKKK